MKGFIKAVLFLLMLIPGIGMAQSTTIEVARVQHVNDYRDMFASMYVYVQVKSGEFIGQYKTYTICFPDLIESSYYGNYFDSCSDISREWVDAGEIDLAALERNRAIEAEVSYSRNKRAASTINLRQATLSTSGIVTKIESLTYMGIKTLTIQPLESAFAGGVTVQNPRIIVSSGSQRAYPKTTVVGKTPKVGDFVVGSTSILSTGSKELGVEELYVASTPPTHSLKDIDG